MRISDDRYSRDWQRFDIALRFIENEARTSTIRQWTGLTDDRIRKLYRSYLCEAGARHVQRHRGKSPHQAAHFLRTLRMRQETALLASICSLLGVVPGVGAAPLPSRLIPGIRRGHLLCHAFEIYRSLVGEAQISVEHAVFLVESLARCEELATGLCHACSALVVVDRLSLREPCCNSCLGSRGPHA
jgi:hypothetical protein